MGGETNLAVILQSLKLTLHPSPYVYTTVQEPSQHLLEASMAIVREVLGTTLILPQSTADEYGLSYEYRAAWITLEVHTALEGVGLTAAVSGALAAEGISCNVIAGYYHDHLFVDFEAADRAMTALDLLSKR